MTPVMTKFLSLLWSFFYCALNSKRGSTVCKIKLLEYMHAQNFVSMRSFKIGFHTFVCINLCKSFKVENFGGMWD